MVRPEIRLNLSDLDLGCRRLEVRRELSSLPCGSQLFSETRETAGTGGLTNSMIRGIGLWIANYTDAARAPDDFPAKKRRIASAGTKLTRLGKLHTSSSAPNRR